MSANTTRLKFIKPTVSGDADVWGGYLNTDLDSLDKLLNAITTTGSANAYVLTTVQSLSAYSDGVSFNCKASFANTGGATMNIDGIGAKNLRKQVNGTLTALASGDINSLDYFSVSYNSANDVLVVAGPSLTGIYQPLDATLTALAALSWSSGNALVQFTAADTVSLTLAPSVTSITASRSAGASSVAAQFTNGFDAATVTVANLLGARATPTASDAITVDWYLNNASSSAVRVARDDVVGVTLTAGAETAHRRWDLILGGSLASYMRLTPTALIPHSNDLISLGASGFGWSDGFYASGAVINFNAGDVTLTHSAAALTLAGGDFIRPTSGITTYAAGSVGYMGTVISAFSNTRTVAMVDNGQTLYHTSASAHTLTIDSNANLALPIGFMFSVEAENGSGVVTIAITSDTLRWGSSTGSRSLAANGSAYLKKMTATTWRLTGTGIT